MGSREAGMGSSTSSRPAVCFGVLLILLCLASCSPSNNNEEITFCSLDDLECLLHGNSGGWLSDPQPEELYTSQCDIEVVDLSFQSLTTKDFVERHLRGDKPVIIIGLQDDWLARQKWARPSFRETYGSYSAQIAAGSVVVGAGGSQLPMLRITDLLDRMEAHMRSGNVTAAPLADFTFDTSVLDHLPGVRGDYRTPEVFGQTFDREERRKMGDHRGDRGRGASWHMLSLAGSRAGLPAHAHGETWLALVHGLKRWFAWPPGGGAAAATQAAAGYHPLEGSWAWFRKVYPRVTEGAAEHPWEVPLECVQRPGEVLFLPAGWNHITLNIGEAIGVGGQASYGPPSRREADAARALATNPGDAIHLVSQGLHFAHRWEMDMGNTDIIEEGLAYLDRAIAANPTDPGAWHTKTKFLLQVALHPEAPLPREVREAYRGRALAALRAGLAAFDRRRVPAAVPDAVLAGMQRKLVELLYPAEEDPAAIEAAVRAVLELSGGGGDGALHVDLALAIQKQQDPQRWGEVADLFDYAVQLGLGSLEPFRVKYLKRKAAQARKNAENEEKRLGAARVAVEHQERREKREQHRQERRPARGAGETPPPRSDPSVVRVQEGVSFSLSREGEIVRSSGSAPPPVGSAGSSRRRTEGQMPLPQSEPTDSPPQSRRRKKQQGNDGGEL